ncbi:UNVERIFIED_CONTAM: hypothetical protein Slati_2230600 [Sesamum latifolium]|uniref:Uncharacterized protein n=1 Tax=Sesamum latifolium TaxID=2727402 RepID=A0AAW2WVY3_9LAMI
MSGILKLQDPSQSKTERPPSPLPVERISPSCPLFHSYHLHHRPCLPHVSHLLPHLPRLPHPSYPPYLSDDRPRPISDSSSGHFGKWTGQDQPP